MDTGTEEKQVSTNEPAEVSNVETAKTEDIETLKVELARAQEETKKQSDEAKRQQQAAIKFSKEVKQWQGEVSNIREQMNTGFNAIAEFLDEQNKGRETTYEETPKSKPSYKERLEAQKPKVVDPQIAAKAEHLKEVANEIITTLKPLGVEFDKSKEFREAYLLFETGNIDQALEEVKEKASKMTTKPTDDKDAKLAELQARLDKYERKETLKQKGELVSERGQPAGASLSDEQFKKDFAAGVLPVNKENIERLNKINKR